MILKVNPEFGIELALAIPFAYWLNVKSNLEILARFRGIQAQCKYAESFKILKMVN